MPHTRLTLLFLLICLTLSGKSQEQPHVFKGATLITISNGVITNGAMVVQNGKIAAVGAAETTALPADAVVIDVTGKTIMPGLVDTHSHLGRVDGGDRSATLHPDVRALDAIDVKDTSLKKALAGGITTLNIMPGSGYLMSGQTAYLKLRNGQKIEDLLYCNDPLTEICGGMKMANGTNPLGDPPFSGTRAKSAALVRQLFIKAQEYKAKIVAAHGDPQKMPERD
jgi:imidazolonepropionase-like amidohydrolase